VPYPRISIIRFKRSNSEAPGNNGNPRNNSATMHPKDHISIAVVYLTRVKDQKEARSTTKQPEK